MIQVCSGLRAGLALAAAIVLTGKQACRGQCLSEPAAAPRFKLFIEESSSIQPCALAVAAPADSEQSSEHLRQFSKLRRPCLRVEPSLAAAWSLSNLEPHS